MELMIIVKILFTLLVILMCRFFIIDTIEILENCTWYYINYLFYI